VRIGLLFRALGAAAVLVNVDPLTELNSLRAANGIPAGIAENAGWSAGCAAHMRYLALNDFEGEWHTEVPGRAGYSDAGKQAAGSSVLSNAPSVGLDPEWETAPFHFAQLLAPKMSKESLIIVNLSGRGDKDVSQVADKVGLQMPV